MSRKNNSGTDGVGSINSYPQQYESYDDDDNDDDLENNPLLVDRVAAAEAAYNNHKKKKKSKKKKKDDGSEEEERPKGSLGIVILTMFLSSTGFTIVLPSLWPFLQSVGGTKSFLGWVVAGYSIGQLIASPVFGFWSNRRPNREPLIVTLLISIVANLLYAFSFAPWMVLVTRFLVGIGAGNVSVVRAYASHATTMKNRNATMANMSAAQGIGFVVGPALGSLLSFIPSLPIFHVDLGRGVHWNMALSKYTNPGFLSALLGIINLVFIICKFKEVPHDQHHLDQLDQQQQQQQQQEEEEEEAATTTTTTVAKVDMDTSTMDNNNNKKKKRSRCFFACLSLVGLDLIAVVVSIWCFFVVLFVFAVFETVGTPLTQHYYDWSVFQNGILFTAAGVVSIVAFMIVKLMGKIQFRYYRSQGNSSNSSSSYNDNDNDNDGGTRHLWRFRPFTDRVLVVLSLGLTLVGTAELVNFQSTLSLWRFLVGAVAISVGYPIASVMIYTVFSKVLGPRGQGTMMGWLTAGGSLARILGPVWASYSFDTMGASLVFTGTSVLLLLALVSALVFYGRLVQHKSYPDTGDEDVFAPVLVTTTAEDHSGVINSSRSSSSSSGGGGEDRDRRPFASSFTIANLGDQKIQVAVNDRFVDTGITDENDPQAFFNDDDDDYSH